MFAVTAVAGHRNTGAPEYYLVRVFAHGTTAPPRIDESNPGVVYAREELVDLIEDYGQVVAYLPGVTPQPLRVQLGTRGFRFVESVHDGLPTNLLRKLPTFPFLREARMTDLANLLAIDEAVRQPAPTLPQEVMQRYVKHGWVRDDGGRPALTIFGKALLAYGGGRPAKPPVPPA